MIFAAAAVVWLRFLGTLGEELDGGIARDALILSSSLSVFGLSIDFGNQNGWLCSKVGGQFLPSRSEGFAVFSPLVSAE